MSRTKYTYNIPTGAEVPTTSVTLVELTAEEEMMATKRSRNDPIRLAFELAKSSLINVDGVVLGAGDGSLDRVWEKLHPKVRSFVMQAFNQIHAPREEDVSTFLASRQVET